MTRWLFGGAGVLALSSALLLTRVGAAPARDVEAGRALYARNCVVCHGESARGDGPAAAGFATRPTDLTDGRLLNPLPDEVLVRIILDGGPAEGLSPVMPPFRGHLGEDQARQIVAYLR